MTKYTELSLEQLRSELESLTAQYEEYRGMGLKLNMARGKPSPEQLLLSMPMLDTLSSESVLISEDGTDCANYGGLDGIVEAKRLMASIMGADTDNVIVFGSSSLNVMHDILSQAFTHGVLGETPWDELDKVRWLSVVPGYDRHFAITEYFGIEMINIPMLPAGPDMDMVEELVRSDPAIKGIWCVPQYSNPTGNTYSDETVRRLAALTPAAADFRIYWDNAYAVHHLYEDEEDRLLDILHECEAAGHPDMVYMFASTSKITFAGAGISAMASSPANIASVREAMNVRIISHDKINQLRHARFLRDIDGVRCHMRRHAEILRPKFETVERVLGEELGGLGIGSWTRPRGGYFISFDGLPRTARRTVGLCRDLGVVLTGAGATYPYGQDPTDSNIRIAPSYPTVEEIHKAMAVFALSVKIASIETLLDRNDT